MDGARHVLRTIDIGAVHAKRPVVETAANFPDKLKFVCLAARLLYAEPGFSPHLGSKTKQTNENTTRASPRIVEIIQLLEALKSVGLRERHMLGIVGGRWALTFRRSALLGRQTKPWARLLCRGHPDEELPGRSETSANLIPRLDHDFPLVAVWDYASFACRSFQHPQR